MIWPENLALSSGYIPIELRFRDGHREIAAMPFEVARISRVVRRHSGELYKIFVDESFHSFFGFDVPTGYLGHSISIGVGSATPTVINLSSLTAGSQNLAGLASAFNADGIGVTTSVVTSASGSRLSLASNTSASLSVTSSVTDGATALAYTATGVSDTLTGSFSIAIGSAAPTVFNLSSLPAADQNLNGLVSAINQCGRNRHFRWHSHQRLWLQRGPDVGDFGSAPCHLDHRRRRYCPGLHSAERCQQPDPAGHHRQR
jgi:hypothetical protein